MLFLAEPAAIAGLLIAAFVLLTLFFKVLPKKYDGSFFSRFTQWVHDFFHFKKLYLESILRILFTVATVVSICVGIMLLFGYSEVPSGYDWETGKTEFDRVSTFTLGLQMIFLIPVALRLCFEGLMMFVLLVKNTMEINRKLSDSAQHSQTRPVVYNTPPAAPSQNAAPTSWLCSRCGHLNPEGAHFCSRCGNKQD